MSVYDPIAWLYDTWSRTVREDVSFYVEEAVRAGGPVVELGVGTGRIAVPVALAGVPTIGVDASEEMLAVCRSSAIAAGVADALDLRLGDYCAPPVTERVRLVTVPFRAYLHLLDDGARGHALRAAYDVLLPGGRLVFDVFAPSREDIEETNGRWLEREPGIFERADWFPDRQRLLLSVRGDAAESRMELAWLDADGWRAALVGAGFAVEALYGWFDRRPYRGGEDQVWIATRPA